MLARHLLAALLLVVALRGVAISQQGPMLVLQTGHSGKVTAVSFSRDGARLASASTDGTLKIWDVTSRALLRDIRAGQGALHAVAFAPDGHLVATAGSNGTVAVWDARTLARLRTDACGEGPVNALAFSPDSQLLASTTWRPEEHVVVLRDADSGTPRPPLVAPGGEPRALAFSPDGSRLALGVAGQTAGRNVVELWSVPDGRLIRLLPCPRQSVTAVAFTPDGRHVGAATTDGTVELFDVQSGARVASLRAGFRLDAVAFAPEGEVLIVGGEGAGALFSLSSGATARTLRAGANVTSLAWSPDGTLVAGGAQDGRVGLWSPTGGLVATFPAGEAWRWTPAFQPDGTLTVRGTLTNGAPPLTWDSRTLTLRAEATPPQPQQASRVPSSATAAYAEQGGLRVFGDSSGLVRIVDGRTGRLRLRLDAGAPVLGVAASLDGSLVAAACGARGRGRVIVWELRQGTPPRVLEEVGGEARCVAFSSHGTAIAVGGGDGVARLFDTRTGTRMQTFEGHTDGIWGISLSPDGALLASGSRDGTVGVWDARGGKRLLTWTTGPGGMASMPRQWIAYDPAGYFVGSEHAASLVRWRTGDELESAERFAHLFYRPDLVEQVLGRGP